MAKKIPCILIFHGSFKQIDGGEHESKSSAKKHVTDINWNRPYTIIPLKQKS